MAIVTSGTLSANNIKTELNVSSTSQMALGDDISRALAQKVDGKISFYDFYGKSKTLPNITSVTKQDLIYEIFNIMAENQQLKVSGFAYIPYKQHFIDASTHSIYMTFVSESHEFTVKATLTPLSKTSDMAYVGTTQCAIGALNQAPSTCYFQYENVGFTVYIPKNMFRKNTTYQSSVVVHAKSANLIYTTPTYYPLGGDTPSVYDLGGTIVSQNENSLANLVLTINTLDSIGQMARKEPSKTGLVWYSGVSCSTTYVNQLFFLNGAKWSNVFEVRRVGDICFYRLSANLFICSNNRRRIIEGSALSPVWINSLYTNYSGAPLTLTVT